MRVVNHGLMDLGQFDLAKEFAVSEQVLTAAKGGKDPFAAKTGDFKRHYALKAANEIMPYRLYVPPAYNSSRAWPLVVALHGLGGTEDSMFGAAYKVSEQAARLGYIAVAPLGYRIDGGYGRGDSKRAQLSEQDVMEVLALVRQRYNIDNSRIYLVGHSMGGGGTWQLGGKYADIWAAIAPISGPENPAAAEKVRHLPIHGGAWRRRYGGAGGSKPSYGGGAEEAGRQREVCRSARRQPRQRFRTEYGSHFRLLRRAREDRFNMLSNARASN